MLFAQTFNVADLLTVAILMVLETVLSIDNAVVLGVLAQRVAPDRPRQGSVLRAGWRPAAAPGAISVAAFLLHWSSIRLLGGVYLVYIAVTRYSLVRTSRVAVRTIEVKPAGFWSTVCWIEITDMAFAIDSILAAVALVGPAPPDLPASGLHPKLWVIVTGGMLGVIAVRFAASLVVRLLARFPTLVRSAYLLVLLIGAKLLLDWALNSNAHPHCLDFSNPHRPEFWVFWVLMALCLVAGLPAPRHSPSKP